MNMRGKNRFFNLRFLYSQDLSNYKTNLYVSSDPDWFLYSQDLSNYKTLFLFFRFQNLFLYSQDLSNYKTVYRYAISGLFVFVFSRFK